MREIKFRAWDEKENKIRKVTKINWFDECVECDEHPNGDYIRLPLEKANLMQYTGLKDKNGKEIYEGDILTCEGGYEAPEGEEVCQDVSQVYWDNDLLQFRVQCRCGDFWSLEEYDYEEIIGNIYQNPELLK